MMANVNVTKCETLLDRTRQVRFMTVDSSLQTTRPFLFCIKKTILLAFDDAAPSPAMAPRGKPFLFRSDCP